MQRSHFMGILRNGIMKKYKKSPEAVIAQTFKGIAGIGLIDDVVSIVNWIIQKLGGGKGNSLEKNDVIDTSDAAGVPAEVTASIQTQGVENAPGYL